MSPDETRSALVLPRALLRLAALLLLLLPVACSRQQANKGQPAPPREPAVPVTVATVELTPLDRTIPVVGTLYAKDEATLAAEVEGRVEKTLVEFGDRIQSGQLLAQIDTTTYEALARQATANLARTRANAVNAEQNLKRIQELRQRNIAPESDLDTATAEARQSQATVKAAEATEAIALLNLERSKVKAPFDAAVAERIASEGDFLKAGSPLFRVVNDGVLKFIFQVPERYAGQVRKDQPVVFSVDAWPGQTFEGGVYLISPQVNTTTRSFNVGALVQNPARKLKASTFARGELLLERAVPTAVVPLEAMVVFAGVTKVFVIESDIARSRDVQAGRVRGGRQEILGGLKPGEVIAVSGQTKLFDGAKVKVKEPPKSEVRTKFEGTAGGPAPIPESRSAPEGLS
jgi:membrane fusion protein, multidrug efflux system